MYTFKSEKELENIIRIDKSIPNKVIENAKYHIGLVEESYEDGACGNGYGKEIGVTYTGVFFRTQVKAQNRLGTDTKADTYRRQNHGNLHDNTHGAEGNVAGDFCLIAVVNQRVVHNHLHDAGNQRSEEMPREKILYQTRPTGFMYLRVKRIFPFLRK